MILMSETHRRILARIHELGLTEAAAMRKAGLSPKFLAQFKGNPTRVMRGESAKKLAPVLGKSIEWVIVGNDPVDPSVVESQISLESELLDQADEATNDTLIKSGISLERPDYYKLVAYHYERLYRAKYKLEPIDE